MLSPKLVLPAGSVAIVDQVEAPATLRSTAKLVSSLLMSAQVSETKAPPLLVVPVVVWRQQGPAGAPPPVAGVVTVAQLEESESPGCGSSGAARIPFVFHQIVHQRGSSRGVSWHLWPGVSHRSGFRWQSGVLSWGLDFLAPPQNLWVRNGF